MIPRFSKVIISLILCLSLLPLVTMNTAWADEDPTADSGQGLLEGSGGSSGSEGPGASEATSSVDPQEPSDTSSADDTKGTQGDQEDNADASQAPAPAPTDQPSSTQDPGNQQASTPDQSAQQPTDLSPLAEPTTEDTSQAAPTVNGTVALSPLSAQYAIQYQAHVATIGWQSWTQDGKLAGTTGKAISIEALNIKLSGTGLTGSVEYRTHVQSKGWLGYVKDGATSGTTGKSLRAEAVSIRLTGELANTYDIYYRVYSQKLGWLDWTMNGSDAGTTGFGYRMEAIEIRLVAKGAAAPGPTDKPFVKPVQALQARAHVQSIGWQGWVAEGKTAGTTGKRLRMEAFALQVAYPDYSGSIEYKANVAGIGWQDWKSNGAIAGTTGQARQVNAVQIQLTGKLADVYDVYYRVHSAKFGWLGWAKNGEVAGVSGFSCRVEALQVHLVPKGGKAPGSTANHTMKLSYTSQGYSDSLGWLAAGTGKRVVGTTGQALRLEAFKLSVTSDIAGGIEYNAYVQDASWQGWTKNGADAGAAGQGKRIEAIRIRLTGDLADYFDVYYRAHVQGIGWMGWAKNGADAGTTKLSLRMEAFEIAIVMKGAPAPGSTAQPYTDTMRIRILDPSKPMIALTFDDGPGIYTTQLLDILDKNNARATFFVIGSNALNYPNVLRDAYNRGDEIAGHSMQHQTYTTLGTSAIQSDISRTNQAIKKATGNQPPSFLRVPGGTWNQTVLNAAAGTGSSVIQWNVDPKDWQYRDANTVYNNVMSAAKPGSIVVLHDIYPSTISAMERVIPALKAKGYQVVTVSELLYYSNKPLVPGQVYYSGK